MGPKPQKRRYLGGGFVFFLLGDQNRNFLKYRGPKLLLNLFFIAFKLTQLEN